MSDYNPLDYETQARTGSTERLHFAAPPVRTMPTEMWAAIVLALVLILALSRAPQPVAPPQMVEYSDHRVCVISISSCN